MHTRAHACIHAPTHPRTHALTYMLNHTCKQACTCVCSRVCVARKHPQARRLVSCRCCQRCCRTALTMCRSLRHVCCTHAARMLACMLHTCCTHTAYPAFMRTSLAHTLHICCITALATVGRWLLVDHHAAHAFGAMYQAAPPPNPSHLCPTAGHSRQPYVHECV